MYQQIACFLFCILMFAASCSRTPSDVWQDSKSAGRHVGRGIDTLGGKHGESRQIRSNEEFDGASVSTVGKQSNDDFIALEDSRQEFQVSEQAAQSSIAPGELGSPIPGIDGFKDPSEVPEYAALFKHIHFDYNSSLIKGNETLEMVQRIALFLQSHPNVYVFVEGHCDKRGPAAYNYALGANRANAVRNLLIQEGANPDRIFTVSYGKDRLFVDGETEESHQLNRRCQFKIFEQ